jgi:hypothetical protein
MCILPNKKELKTLRSKNPKEYWKILNKGQKKKQPNISIDVLYEFFKNLNGAPDHDNVELSVLSESLQENLDFDNLYRCCTHFLLYLPEYFFYIKFYRIN